MAIELHPHQSRAVREMHNGCILNGDVGSGKTITALMYFYVKVCGGIPNMKGVEYRPAETPRDIYVVTTAKKRDHLDWEKEAAHFGISREPNENGIKLHVLSWNEIGDADLVTGAFFVFDEQRLVGNGAWVKAFYKIAANNQWIMLSATPGDNWMDYIPVFIANGFYKNRTEFLRAHVKYNNYTKFPKVDYYIGTKHLESLKHKVLVEMPYERHTIRKVENVIVDYDRAAYDRITKDRWHIYEDRPIKDVSEMFIVVRKLINSDVSRMGALMQLIEKHPRLIIFYNFNYELEILRNLAKILSYPKGEWNGHKHEQIPDDERWLYLVQYTAGAEGWNCTTTDAIALYSLNYSYKITEQSKGRIDRLDTPYTNLYYYVLRSMAPIDVGILRSLTTKQNFNEKKYSREQHWDRETHIPKWERKDAA